MKKFDINRLNKYIEDKWVMKQSHPNLDLHIYNYTQFTQYERHWDEITLACRGLILDSEGNVIARGFNKFFNIEEHAQDHLDSIPNLPFTVTDKMDGSLLIVFKYKDEIICASRGSFTSEQALKGYEIISETKRDIFKKDYTYLFEIIYPENRIVVDYGNLEDIILLGIIDTETNRQIPHNELASCMTTDFSIVKAYDAIKDFDTIKDLIDDDKEGYVVTFSNGLRIKIKGDEYCRLHRIITEISSKNIWEHLKDERPFDEILDKVPDEFYDWVKDTKEILERQFKNTWFDVIERFNSLENKYGERKDFAIEISKIGLTKGFKSLLFHMLDADLIRLRESIWKLLKPDFEKPFKNK